MCPIMARGETMAWQAPSAERMEAMAQRSLDALPGEFREHMGNVVIRVEEFADEETLDALGIGDPMNLSGLYTGRPVGEKSISDPAQMPDVIHLYRRPILAEAQAFGYTVERLVHHVLIHEIGHHFGLSDADMHLLEEQAG